MRASYTPIYYGRSGPLQAILVPHSFSVKDRFIDVVVTDQEHLRTLGVKLTQRRVLVHVVNVPSGQHPDLRDDSKYSIYVRSMRR